MPLKKSNLHIIEVDEEGRKSPILGCDVFSNKSVPEFTKKRLLYDEIFVIEESPTCGSVFSKRFVLSNKQYQSHLEFPKVYKLLLSPLK